MNPKLIILDRDGVINHDSPDYIKTPAEWIPIPGSLEAIAKLSQAGFKIILATNQSGINRGFITIENLNAIFLKMIEAINLAGGKLSGIYFCPHTPDENCDCRKPKPGLLLQILQDHHAKNTDMIFVGDSVKDYEAAKAVGCKFILVKTGNGAQASASMKNVESYNDLLAASEALLLKEE